MIALGATLVAPLAGGACAGAGGATLAHENVVAGGVSSPAGVAARGARLVADGGGSGAAGRFSPLTGVRTPTTISLRAQTTSAVYAAVDVLSATVSAAGTVTFFADGAAIAGCSDVVTATTATCAWSPSSVGAVTVTASLRPGDATDAPSSSAPVVVSVRPAASTVRLTVTGPGVAAVSGARLTATATVSVPGTVTFSANGRTVPGCLGVPAPATTATCHLRAGSAGRLTVTASLAPASPDDAPSSQGVTFGVVAPRRATRIGPFAIGGATLTPSLARQVALAATAIARDGYRVVGVLGHERPGSADGGGALARARAVAARLRSDLAARGAGSVRVVVAVGTSGAPSVTVTMAI